MKGLSCNSGVLSSVGVEQAIRVLAELGYQAIDVSLEVSPPFLPVPAPHMSPAADANTRKRVRRCAEQAGIAIAALNAHTNLIHAAPEIREANCRFVKGAVGLAADLGARSVIVGSGRKDFYGRESQYWDWLLSALRDILAEAEARGVVIAFEAAGLPGVLVHDLAGMEKLLSSDGLESLRVLFDPSHYHIRGDDVIGAYRALSERVAHIHVKDARGNAEDFEFPPLGMGNVDWAGLLGAILATGYSGYLSVEYEAFAWGYDADPRQVLAESKAFLERIIAEQPRAQP